MYNGLDETYNKENRSKKIFNCESRLKRKC